MWVVFSFSLLALGLTWLDSQRRLKGGMILGFILVTIIGAIHYNYGNDYEAYYTYFKEANWKNGILFRDPGWIVLNLLFKHFGGFFTMVAVLNIFQNFLIFRTVKTYVQREWWWFAMFIYLFTTSYYLLSFSMMRQSLCMFIFLGICPWIINKKWYYALPIILLLSTIHGSSLILIPFAFWGFIPISRGRLLGKFYILLLLFLYFGGRYVEELFTMFIGFNERFSDYASTYSENRQNVSFGLGFIINLIPFLLSIIFISSKYNKNIEVKLIVALASLGALITPFTTIIPLMTRIGMYFGTYTIISLPWVYSKIRNNNLQILFIGLFIMITIYSYIGFFENPIWVDYFTEYHTIFETF